MQKNEYTKQILLVISLVLLFMVPDYIVRLFNESYKVSFGYATFLRLLLMLMPLSVGLIYNKYKWLTYAIIALLCGLQLMQFSIISCFGRVVTPYDFVTMFDEWHDILLGAVDAFSKHWLVIPAVLIPFALVFVLTELNIKRSVIGTFVLLVTLGSVFVADCFLRGVPYPIDGRIALDNTLKSFSFAIRDIFAEYKTPKYASYEIKNVGIKCDEPITVVYIVGESMTANHMSLYGYERDTTPLLKKLAENENFYYTRGIAGAVCTKAANKFMANVIWEPNNVKLNANSETSLCKLAHDNGFKVFYITSQDNKMLSSICTAHKKYIDVCVTKTGNEATVDKRRDEYILDTLDKQELTERNFIIIHQRCPHCPYTENFPEGYTDKHHYTGSHEPKIDEYDNVMLYEDTFLSRVFDRFNKQISGKFYIIFASDHNELFGEEGVWGHSSLVPICAEIPVMAQSNDDEFMKRIKSIYKPTHYEIAQMIAGILGYKIHNPNQKGNVFHINGLDYDGRNGYMEAYKDEENKTVTYKTYR